MSSSTAPHPETNKRQVGGRHYGGGAIQHWDLFGTEYYVGCATKYVSRHPQKNGRQDLEKAVHFMDKIIENQGSWSFAMLPLSRVVPWLLTLSISNQSQLALVSLLCTGDVALARAIVLDIIEKEYPAVEYTMTPAPGYTIESLLGSVLTDDEPRVPGTPEDGGHHARQPVEELVRWGENEGVEWLHREEPLPAGHKLIYTPASEKYYLIVDRDAVRDHGLRGLTRELNAIEHEQERPYYQPMYYLQSNTGKYVLRGSYDAWAREEG